MDNSDSNRILLFKKYLTLYSNRYLDSETLKTAVLFLWLKPINISSLTVDEINDLAHYKGVYLSIIETSSTPENVKLDLLKWDKRKETVKILRRVKKDGLHQNHNFQPILISDHVLTVYLDQNIISHLIESSVSLDPSGYQIIYSPSHIDEIVSSDKRYHIQFLNYISSLTKDTEIIYQDNGIPIFGRESPTFVYNNRSLPEIDNINSAKSLKAIDYLINLSFNCSNPSRYNGTKTFENPQLFCNIYKEEFRKVLTFLNSDIDMDFLLVNKEPITNYYCVNNIINDIYYAMDIMGFKRDSISSNKIDQADSYEHKYYKKIRSSRLDIEHLLYASACNYFLTRDGKLYYRAKIIFYLLKSKCKVLLVSDNQSQSITEYIMEKLSKESDSND